MSKSDLLSLTQAQPSADFIPRLSALVEAMIEAEGWSFGCDTMVFTAADVASPTRLLPLVLHRSATWMQSSLGAQAPMDYRQTLDPVPGEEIAPLCQAVPEATYPTASLVTWGLYIRHTLGEWVDRHPTLAAKKEPIPLDSWYLDWLNDLDSGTVQLLPATTRVAPDRPRVSPLDAAVQPGQSQPTGARASH